MRRKLSIGLAAVGLIAVGGCGDQNNSETGGSALLPEATVDEGAAPAVDVATSSPDDAMVTAVDSGIVGEPCPTDTVADMAVTDSSVVIDETSRLEPMLAAVLRYGGEHPDVFGGYGLHWFSVGDASVFVSFTGDLATHRAALAELVDYPDELIVCQAPASEADRRAIQETLVSELDGRFTEIGSGGKSGAVNIALNPTEEVLAGELVDRYGSAVEVRVGALTYPLDDAEAVCAPRLEPSLLDGLDVTVIDSAEPVQLSDAGTVPLAFRLTNTGDRLIRFDSGAPSTTMTDAEGSPRTSDPRIVPEPGIEIAIEPGAYQDFEIEASAASCDPTLGYVLPAGDHFVVASFYNAQLQANMNSEPIPITLVD